MVMDDPVQKIPTTLVTADSTGAPDAGGLGCHFNPALRFNRNSKENKSRKRQLLLASHITCQRFGDLLLFGLVRQYSTSRTIIIK